MMDMTSAIQPKSDQVNADSLLSGPITIKIRKMEVRGEGEQRISVYFDGDNDKPFKPCKSMARVMVQAWGTDAKNYVGKSMTIYNDPTVKWGGMEVGGIRISHMSDIDSKMTLILTATRGSKKPYIVKPLTTTEPKPADTDALKTTGNAEALKGSEPLKSWWKSIGGANQKLLGAAYLDELKIIAARVTGDEEIPI